MNAAAPRVIHVTTTDISLELLLGPQLEAFARAGYDVIGMSAPGPYVPAIEARGIRHVALAHATRSTAPTRDARAFGELVGHFRGLRPAIVHTHNPKPGVYARVAARLAAVPVVVNTVHGLYAQPTDRWRKRAAVYAIERVAAAFGHLDLVQSRDDLATLRSLRIPARRLVLLGNGVDLERFSPERVEASEHGTTRTTLRAGLGVGPDTIVVGMVGRLVREKGFAEAFAAAHLVGAAGLDARFVVIGGRDDDKGDALTSAEIDSATAAGVHLVGERSDVERWYRAMDLFVFPSHREGFPRAPMEASAMGLAIIASDIRGCREVVEPGVNGVLVPANDAAMLAAAIESLALDPARRASMGIAARTKAQRDFDQQRCIDITLAEYARLLRARGLPVPASRHPDVAVPGPSARNEGQST
jgi:glycosyltransferase involved in cell wall biosynthesis